MKTINRFLLLAGLLSLAACTKDSLSTDPGKVQAGFVKGHVVDTQGRPLAEATIIANNAIWVGKNVIGTTDANGNYRISLPNEPGIGAFYVRGNVKMKFEGKTYQLPLFTEADDTFLPDEGAVKNLQLKLWGEKTGNFGDDGLYGGTVEVTNRTSFNTGDIEFMLEPISLIDGSKGETLTFHTDYYTAQGVPIGKYRVSARRISTNQPLYVRILDSNQAYEESVTTIFQSSYYIETIYEMHIEVAE
ncbi:hypothetical protein GO755_27650 [Spirosoma sp. HMF4905]|uniref:Carboxypeptidase regulatory-like domain-containing protein n=1 Tax=Spirosoma arboris TaxID=2682092 RepID=A0A7K1SJ68_9BACT|nr:carboxypeptidase-like regulatory domain-containing protein [Spirosoma arboris]MVM33842.1 hypothetical protein [Spirosoma arboris]